MAQPVTSTAVVGLLPHRACQNCVQIKVKCIPQGGADAAICERCCRLRKTCMTTAPTSRKRRRGNWSKVAQLEDRLNQLSALVTPANTMSGNSAHSSTPDMSPPITSNTQQIDNETEKNTELSTMTRDQSGSSGIHRGFENGLGATCRPNLPSTTDEEPSTIMSHEGDPDPYQDYPVSTDASNGPPEANIFDPPHLPCSTNHAPPVDFCPIFLDSNLETTLFEDFRTNMSPFFPFVVLDESVTTDITKRQRPFLFWACIVAASHHQRQLHKRLSEEMLKAIGEYAFSKGTKNLDLLQGILVMIAWYHYYAHVAPQMMNLLHLANSLVVDLGLNRPRYGRGCIRMMTDLSELIHGQRVITGLKTSDERRALLGCYFLLSKSSLSLTRNDPMRYSQHIQECCRVLEESAEFKSDRYLVQLIQLHRITGKYIYDDFATPRAPLRMYSTLFVDEVKRWQQDSPPALQNHAILTAEVASCRVSVHEPSSFAECDDSLEGIESLHLCLMALGEFFDVFATIPVEQCACTAFPTWISVMHCLTVHARLCFLNVNGWDLDYVRTKLSFVSTVQTVVEKFEAVHAYHKTSKLEKGAWRFSLYAEKMRRCRQWYEAKIRAEEKNALTLVHNNSVISNELPNSFTLNLFDVDFDDAIWTETMGNWTQF